MSESSHGRRQKRRPGLPRVHAGIRVTRAAGVPASTCMRRSWVAPLPGGWAKATKSPWPGPATATATATATRPKSTASTEFATGPVRVCRSAEAAPTRRWQRPDSHGGHLYTLFVGDTARMAERNVLGGELEPCGADPVTGFYRDGCCNTGPEDLGSHTVCAVVTAEFLEHQRRIGNDLSTPMPQYRFPGLVPGDRWCVTAANWLRSHLDGAAAYVVLASTHERALEVVPLAALEEHAVDVPSGPGGLGG